MINALDVENDGNVIIKVVGIGGCGIDALNSMITNTIVGVEFIAIGTDKHSLENCLAETKVYLDCDTIEGNGDRYKAARQVAVEEQERIKAAIGEPDMIFIVTRMGDDTGTAIAPIVAEILAGKKILTLGVVSTPFFFEGKGVHFRALKGVLELNKNVDCVIDVIGDGVLQSLPPGTTIHALMEKSREMMHIAIKDIVEFVTVRGLICIDFADVYSVMKATGRGRVGTAVARGEHRATKAATEVINSPLLGHSLGEARGILLNITCSADTTIDEISEVASIVQEAVLPDVQVVFGSTIEDSMGDSLRATVVAAGVTYAHTNEPMDSCKFVEELITLPSPHAPALIKERKSLNKVF